MPSQLQMLVVNESRDEMPTVRRDKKRSIYSVEVLHNAAGIAYTQLTQPETHSPKGKTQRVPKYRQTNFIRLIFFLHI